MKLRSSTATAAQPPSRATRSSSLTAARSRPSRWADGRPASGKGTVYSFTVIRQNYSRPFRDWIPYVVALVDLEEGPRVMTNLIDCDPETVQVGMAVEARFEVVSEVAGIALFTPA